MQNWMTSRDGGVATHDEAHLLARLRPLLATRSRDAKAARLGAPETSAVQENRRMIRDCIAKLRLVRAGVGSPFLGLGQRAIAL